MSACPQPPMNPPLPDQLAEISDELLVSAAKAGDAMAFMELVRRHVDRIKSQVNRIMRNRNETDDVFQEAIIRAYIHLHSFEARSSFSTWLTRIAMNSALMRLRKRRGIEIPLDSAFDGSERRPVWEPADGRATPEEYLVKREREEMVNKAIFRLPQKLRIVVEIQQAHEYSAREIAKQLGISVPAVKSRLSRARRMLRILIAEF